MTEPNQGSDELKVFILRGRDSTCGECKEGLGKGSWVTLAGEKGAVCLECADLDHLVFLASGDAALTRRARKHSVLSAVVLEWSRSRKRYERQGLLVEAQALEQAERECLADADARQRRGEREAARRAGLDRQYVDRFAARLRELFPGCPEGREFEIAEHACLKYSDRVGRSAAAKALDEEAVRLALTRTSDTGRRSMTNSWRRAVIARKRAAVEVTVRRVLQAWEART